MASDTLQAEAVEPLLTNPLYGAFKRPMPESLQDPADALSDLLGGFDEHIHELENLAKTQAAEATLKKAAEYRKIYVELDKKVSAETTAKKKDAKRIAKLTEEASAFYERVNAELEVPIREAGMIKALEALKGRANPSRDKLAAFEKRQEGIAKENDPAKRCQMYFQLERDIIKGDLKDREALDPGSTWQDHVEIGLADSRPLGVKGKATQDLVGLKNKVLRRPPPQAMSDQEFQATKTAFVNSCTKKIDDMAFSVAPAAVDKFKTEAAAQINAIADKLFDPATKPVDSHGLGKLLVRANTQSLQQLMALKRAFPADQTPQVMVEDGKLVIAKPAPKIQSLVLQGGGSKGAGYPPMLEEMKAAGMLDDIDLLVGTSIGALNASCLACGGLADERQILDMPIMKQVFDSKEFKKQYPDVTFGKPGLNVSDILPSCAGQMAKIDQLTAASIADNLKSKSEDAIGSELSQKLSNLDDDMLAKMGLEGASAEVIDREIQKLAKKVKNQDFKSSDRTSQMITFKDLAMLHQPDPVNFKELTVTGWEGTGEDGHEEYFNAKNYGEMPIALAARISMSLPIFSPVYWRGRGPFYDGGLGSNAPVEATPGLDDFYKGKNPADAEDELKGDVPVEVQEAMAKTMLMTFDDKGKGEANLYGQGKATAAPSGGEKKMVIDAGLNSKYADTLTGDATKVYNTGVNTLEVYHGDMDTVTIMPSAEDIEYAENMARMKGLEQLDARSDQAAIVKCANTDEALLGLSSADKRNLVKAGKPTGGDPKVGELYDKCVQYLDLEDASQKIGADAGPFLGELESSPLCATFGNDIKQLHAQYNVHVHGQSNAQALAAGIKTTAEIIARCPAYLRPMLTQAILLPMQQRRRSLPKPTGADAPTFLWQQQFSAAGFHNSLTVAEKSNVPYLKEAYAAHEALKRYESRAAELAGKSKPKDQCEAGRKALTAIETFQMKLRLMSEVETYKAIPTMLAYIRWLDEKTVAEVDRLCALAKGKNAAYPQYAFVPWDKKDWEQKKDEAITSGAIEDPGSTDLGSLMERAVEAQTTWTNAAEVAKEKTGKAAWNAWDKLNRKAKEIQTQTDNQSFSAYLAGCITAAAQQRDRVPPP